MIAKDKHTMLSFIGAVLSILALISFVILWKTTPYEASEMPIPVIAVTAVSVVAFALAGFKNLFHVVNIAAYALITAALFLVVMGRASYVAFYVTGDAMNTGFSPMLIVTLVLMLVNIIIGIMAIFSEKA